MNKEIISKLLSQIKVEDKHKAAFLKEIFESVTDDQKEKKFQALSINGSDKFNKIYDFRKKSIPRRLFNWWRSNASVKESTKTEDQTDRVDLSKYHTIEALKEFAKGQKAEKALVSKLTQRLNDILDKEHGKEGT